MGKTNFSIKTLHKTDDKYDQWKFPWEIQEAEGYYTILATLVFLLRVVCSVSSHIKCVFTGENNTYSLILLLLFHTWKIF